MKKYTFIIALILLSNSLWAQDDVAGKLFKKYEDQEDFTFVHITQSMMSLLRNFEVDDKDIDNIISGLDAIKIMHYGSENQSVDQIQKINNNIFQFIQSNQFEDLMLVKEKDEEVRFLIKKNQGKIIELIMLSSNQKEMTFISLIGDINLESIAKLSKAMHIDGLEKLEEMDK